MAVNLLILRLFPVMPNILNIIVIVQSVKKKSHLLDMVLVGKSSISRGNLCRLSGKNSIAHIRKRLAYFAYCCGVGRDFYTAILKGEVIAACL